ncbi:hypothetical protein [Flavobacterium sp. NRK1]|uniref:hypothetical protein n=1 Tax=Flavobacterium sp. NRK1 TaxID=2954929 RepID=UPI0020939810|nr:hypothetical protein [Flavobacterium sp. NRK1]MCO6148272.1 hypothetical protein [Flavobacterium sp. NRK1]
MKMRYFLFVILIISNIICLYLIIDLSSYDGMISYLKNGSEKFTNPRQTAMVFLVTCLANLLFISATLMKSIIFSDSNKRPSMRF